MKLKNVSKVNSNGNNDWSENVTEHGLFRSQLNKTDKVSFSNKNLISERNIVVLVYEKNSEVPFMLTLSKALSAVIRKALKTITRNQALRMLLDLKVIQFEVENEDGDMEDAYMIVPEGKPSETFSLADLDDSEEEEVSYEEMVAF